MTAWEKASGAAFYSVFTAVCAGQGPFREIRGALEPDFLLCRLNFNCLRVDQQ